MDASNHEMNRYVALFYTHLAAMATWRALKGAGIEAQMAPVPRDLSASCGTCVRYCAEDAQIERMHADFEGIVRVTGEREYEWVAKNDAAV